MKSRASEVIQRDTDCKKQERNGMEWNGGRSGRRRRREEERAELGLHPCMPERCLNNA